MQGHTNAPAPYEPKFIAPRANSDIALISSDNVRFNAHQAFLSASNVFFDTIFSDVQHHTPGVQMAENAEQLDCLLAHSYATLHWSLDEARFRECINMMELADKFGNPRLLGAATQRLASIVTAHGRCAESDNPDLPLLAFSLGHRYQQQALIDAALPHCGRWRDIEPHMLDPIIGFAGLQQMISAFLAKRNEAIYKFNSIESEILRANRDELDYLEMENQAARENEDETYESMSYDWSSSSSALVQLWKAARELLDKPPLDVLRDAR